MIITIARGISTLKHGIMVTMGITVIVKDIARDAADFITLLKNDIPATGIRKLVSGCFLFLFLNNPLLSHKEKVASAGSVFAENMKTTVILKFKAEE